MTDEGRPVIDKRCLFDAVAILLTPSTKGLGKGSSIMVKKYAARTIGITDDMNLPGDQQSQQELPTGQGKENA
jgi:hypothetical protein